MADKLGKKGGKKTQATATTAPATVNSSFPDTGRDSTDAVAVRKKQYIEIYHIPSGKSVFFKAFLTMFEDQYNSEWERTPVFGRMDPLVNFQGTSRTMSLGWSIPSFGQEDAERNLQKCSLLMSMLYPTYEEVAPNTNNTSANTLVAPPVFKIKMMNLITDSSRAEASGVGTAKDSGLLGVISGFTYTPVLEEGVIEKDGTFDLYPQTINLQCEFTVLHTHQLGWKTNQEPAVKAFPYKKPVFD